MKQLKYKDNDGKETKGFSSSSSSSFTSPSGRGLRKLALLPTLFALAVVASHSRCHVVDASNQEESKKKETDGELIVLDEHDTSIVEFGSGTNRPRRYVVEENEEDDYVEGDHTTSNHDDNTSSEKNNDNLIVVVSVDGTLSGIDKNNGKVLWKQSRDGIETQQQEQQRSSNQHMKPNKSKSDSPQARLLQPLISTTTTTKSATTSEYAAVPSVDGNVYMTSNDVTVTTSIKDLVSRAPFLDNKGRFYVGSRHATAAALDGDTGEILRIVSAADVPAQQKDQISLEGRNTIWIGRIDYSVTVQDARTGIVDAQFSVADMMSVSDMQGSKGIAAWNAEKNSQSDTKQQSTTTPNSAFSARLRQLPAPNEESSTLAASDGGPSALVATPSGNLAFRDADTGELQWVADTSFDSPIAYAMDATSGVSLGVDIIPDVPIPNSNIEYLSREIGRQLELIREQQLEKHDQTIVGAMPNGQLYALPLGGQPQVAATTPLQAQQHAAVAANTAMHITKVPQITGGRTNLHPQTSGDGKQVLATRRHCDPLSSQFPGCLIGHQNQQQRADNHPILSYGSHLPGSELDPSMGDGENRFNNQDDLAVAAVGQFKYPDGGFYHPDLGFVSAQDLQRITQQRMQPPSKKRTLMKIMSSWLPPTIALIFVLSFELGRRKRLKDNQKAAENINHQVLISDDSSIQKVDDGDSSQQQVTQQQLQQQQHVIQVSDEVLGYGGQGTVVYKGLLDGRSVAVKRMLSAYHASADREISLLIESDGHPNVVRYFLKEVRGDFVYLALELCSLSLHDLIGTIRQTEEGTPCDETMSQPAIYESSKSILLQIASGVKHLHALRIVHRDLKPANILLAVAKRKNSKKSVGDDGSVIDTFLKGSYIAKISDMGLGKQLVGQSSLGASWIAESSLRGGSKAGTGSVGVGPGSVGWQAPEVMAARWTASDVSARSGDSSGGVPPGTPMADASTHQRTSRSVDIFSLGCIFHSTLIPGNHPFGEWYEREANIMHNRPKLDALKVLSPDAHDLVSGMLNRNPRLRPTAREICEHPFFWTAQKKVQFLCEFSDRLETDACAGDAALVTNALVIEKGAAEVVGTSWDQHLDHALISNVQKFRSYDTTSVRDLLRLIRNKYHHFDELPAEFRAANACDQNAFLTYFESRFPRLLMHCFNCCRHLLAEDDGFATKYNIVRPPAIEVVSAPVAEVPIQREIFQTADINQVEEGDTPVEVVGDSTTSGEMGEEEKAISFERDFVRVSSEYSSPDEPIDVDLACIELDDTKESNDTETNPVSPEPEVVESAQTANNMLNVDNIIAWEGSSVAKTLNCRGWSRSEDDWSTRIDPFYKKCEPNLKRNLEDPKFRTRLCNHWDESLGTFCTMRKKNKCIFGHGPIELRVKEPKKNRWGKLVDKNGNNSNPCHSGGEDTYGAARSIESARKTEGKWNTSQKRGTKGKKQASNNKKKKNGE